MVEKVDEGADTVKMVEGADTVGKVAPGADGWEGL